MMATYRLQVFPKTGDRAGAHAGLAAVLSGFLMVAFAVLSSKKREEELTPRTKKNKKI